MKLMQTLLEEESLISTFSLTTLNEKDLVQALLNNGYKDMKLEKAKYKGPGSHKGTFVYKVDYVNDGSFEKDSDRKNQNLFIDIDPKTGKVVAEF